MHSWRHSPGSFAPRIAKAAHSSLRYLGGMHENKVALVTGANKGSVTRSRASSRRAASRFSSAHVTPSRGEAAAKRIAGDARPIALDVTRADSIAAAAARIRRELGRLDVLVNNAAIATFGRPSEASLDDVRAVFETNVFGVIAVTQAMLPLLRAGAGRANRQRLQPHRLAQPRSPILRFPMRGVWRRGLRPFEDRAQRGDHRVRPGARRHTHQGELGVPRAHRDRLEWPQRIADGRRSSARTGAPCTARPDGPTGTFSNDAGSIPW